MPENGQDFRMRSHHTFEQRGSSARTESRSRNVGGVIGASIVLPIAVLMLIIAASALAATSASGSSAGTEVGTSLSKTSDTSTSSASTSESDIAVLASNPTGDVGEALDGTIVTLSPHGSGLLLDIEGGYAEGDEVITSQTGAFSKLRLAYDSNAEAYTIGYMLTSDETVDAPYCLTVYEQSDEEKSIVRVSGHDSDDPGMLWRFERQSDGTYLIYSQQDGSMYLSLEDPESDHDGNRAVISSDPFRWDLALVHSEDGFGSEAESHQTYSESLRWMSAVSDSLSIAQISIPGSHDSGTTSALFSSSSQQSSAQTQRYYLDEQLVTGTRALDIRLGADDDPTIVSGSEGVVVLDRDGTALRLSDVIATAEEFLEAHPTETLILLVSSHSGNDADITAAMESWLSSNPDLFWNSDGTEDVQTAPTMGEVRGKIVLLRDYGLSGNSIDDSCFGLDVSGWDDDSSSSPIPIQVHGDDGSDRTGITLIDFTDQPSAREIFMQNFEDGTFPDVIFPTSATIEFGQELISASFDGGSSTISGRFLFDRSIIYDSPSVADSGTEYLVVFVNDRFEIVAESTVPVYVEPMSVVAEPVSQTIEYGSIAEEEVIIESEIRSSCESGEEAPQTEFSITPALEAGEIYRDAGVYPYAAPDETISGNLRIEYHIDGQTYTVEPRELTVSWDGNDAEIVYTGDAAEILPTLGNVIEGDDVIAVVEGGEETEPGTYVAKIVDLEGEDASNYTLPEDGIEFEYTIVQAEPVFQSASEIELVYGQTLAEVVDLEAVFVDASGNQLSGTVEFSSSADLSWTPDAGTYENEVELTFIPDSPRYAETTCTTTLVVEKREIAVNIIDVTTTYGDAFPETGLIEVTSPDPSDPNSGLLPGDTAEEIGLTLVYGLDGLTIENYEDGDGVLRNETDAGTYALSFDATTLENYEVAEEHVNKVTGTWTVEPRTVGLEWANVENRQLGDGLGDPYVSLSNLIVGSDGSADDVSATVGTSAAAGDAWADDPDSGIFSATAISLTGDDAANYTLPDSAVIYYGVRRSDSDVLFPEKAQIVYGTALDSEKILLSGSGDGSFFWDDDEIVAMDSDGETSTVSTSACLPAGTYTLTGSMTFSPADTDTAQSVTEEISIELTVMPMPLTVQISNEEIEYGDALPEMTIEIVSGSLVGEVDVEDLVEVSIVDDEHEELSENTIIVHGVEYNRTSAGTYVAGGTVSESEEASSYDITIREGSLTITPRILDLEWSGITSEDGSALVYDGWAKNVTATATNLVPYDDNGNTEVLAVEVEGGQRSDAGTHRAVAVGLIGGSSSTSSSSNYMLAPSGSSGSDASDDANASNRVKEYTIEKAQPSVEWPQQIESVYGQRLFLATIEGGSATGSAASTGLFSFGRSDVVEGSFMFAGDQGLLMAEHASLEGITSIGDEDLELVFMPSDTRNYTAVSSLEAGVKISVTVNLKQIRVIVGNLSTTYGDPIGQPQVEIPSYQLVGDDSDAEVGVAVQVLLDDGQTSVYDMAVTAKDGTEYNRTPVGSYQIEVIEDGSGSGDYTAVFVPGTLTVDMLTAKIEWSGDTDEDGSDLIYDGSAKSVTATVANAVPTDSEGGFDDVRALVSGGEKTDSGSYTAMVTGFTGDDAGNYHVETGSVGSECVYTIEKATPNVAFPTDGAVEAGAEISGATFGFSGSANVDGCFWYFDSDIALEEGTTIAIMTFDPIDDLNYETVLGYADITVADSGDQTGQDESGADGDSDDGSETNEDESASEDDSGSESDSQADDASESAAEAAASGATGGDTEIADPSTLAQTSDASKDRLLIVTLLIAAGISLLFITYVRISVKRRHERKAHLD